MSDDKNYFPETIARIFEAPGVQGQSALAKALGISQPTSNHGFARESIPKSWLLELVMRYQLNPAWVLHGEPHKKYLVPSDTPVEAEENVG